MNYFTLITDCNDIVVAQKDVVLCVCVVVGAGCPVHLPDLSLADKLSSLSLKERQQFSDTLFIACNWFIEVRVTGTFTSDVILNNNKLTLVMKENNIIQSASIIC